MFPLSKLSLHNKTIRNFLFLIRLNPMKTKLLPQILSFGIFLGASGVFAAPQYPFPQNRTSPYGNTITYAVTDSIRRHFEDWKSAWYVDMNNGTARVISPNDSTEISVSEGIAYGMLLMVYMSSATSDYQSEFDKLWAYWKKYAISAGSPSGMNWHINNKQNYADGTGSASDAELDAALALIMASKQWNNSTYLTEAKTLISWIQQNDMESDGRVRAGSNWNQALNASYVHLAAFKLFEQVTGNSFWSTAVTTNLTHVKACQNATSGLMPDWCTWDSHQATSSTGAAVSGGNNGFFDDAARTPWRMTWGYNWYGIQGAKEVNDAIIDWLYFSTYGYAGLILPGYYMDGSDSPYSFFVSSTYAGGLGLAFGSATNPKNYLETVYDVLSNVVGKTTPTDSKGEKYYAATLNILYMLLLSGNMPNLYDMTGFETFTPTQERMPSEPSGVLQPKNSGHGISGLTKWGIYCDSIGSKMFPASESSGLYLLDDGTYAVQMNFRIVSEPTYEANVEQQYPYAGVALSFKQDGSYLDLSALSKIRITYKSDGAIRMALLTKATLDNDEEGGEPGHMLHPTDSDTTIEISLSAADYSTNFTVPSWASEITGEDALKAIRGIKFEGKMSKGGYGSLVLKTLEFYDAAGNLMTSVIDPDASDKISNATTIEGRISLDGNTLFYTGLSSRASVQMFDLNGNLVKRLSVSGAGSVDLSSFGKSKGVYLVRISDRNFTQNMRIVRQGALQ